MTSSRESASHACQCGHRYNTLADEYGGHPCPRCGWHPADDYLQTDVEAYVERCMEIGSTPDAFAFSVMHQRTYGRTPGELIAQLIETELSKYAAK